MKIPNTLAVALSLVAAVLLGGCTQEQGAIPFAKSAMSSLALNLKFPATVVPSVDGKHAAVLAVPVAVATVEVQIGKPGEADFFSTGAIPADDGSDVQEIEVKNIPPGLRRVGVFARDAAGNTLLTTELQVNFVAGAIASNDVDLGGTDGAVTVVPPTPTPTALPPTPTPTPTPPPPPRTFVLAVGGSDDLVLLDATARTTSSIVTIPMAGLQKVIVDRLTGDYIALGAGTGMLYRVSQATNMVVASVGGVASPLDVTQTAAGDFLVSTFLGISKISAAFAAPVDSFITGFGIAPFLVALFVDPGPNTCYISDGTGMPPNMALYTAPAGNPGPGTMATTLIATAPKTIGAIRQLPTGELVVTEGPPPFRIYLRDATTGAEIPSTDTVLTSSASAFAIDPFTLHAFVALPGEGRIAEIDLAGRMEVDSFPMGAPIVGIDFAP